jgi:hypothetical protein
MGLSVSKFNINNKPKDNISFGKRSGAVYIQKINNAAISDKFVAEIEQAFQHQSIDNRVRRVISRTQNLIIGVAENIQQVFPNKPTDWGCSHIMPNKSAWLFLFENPKAKKRIELAPVIRHEFGHHADLMFVKIQGCEYTDTPDFLNLYLKNKRDLDRHKTALLKKHCPDWQKALHLADYYVEGKSYKNPFLGAKKETFPEIFAKECGGSGAEAQCQGMDSFYDEAFPDVVADVRKLVRYLKKA